MNTENEDKIREDEKVAKGINKGEEDRNEGEEDRNKGEESGNEGKDDINECEYDRNECKEDRNEGEDDGNEGEEGGNEGAECGNEGAECGNEAIQNKCKKASNSKKEPKPKKESKPKFSSNCSKCNKLFKNELFYNKHTLEQVCYKSNEITHCKICKIKLDTHNEYKKHLYSLNHINNIGYNTIEKINTSPTQTIHHLDPFLNKNDVESIASKNLGNSFTLVFDTGKTQTVNLKHNIKENTTTNETINTTINETTNTIENNNIILNEEQHIKPPDLTERQTKIINFLKKQISENKSIETSGITFYKMLDNKLQLEDYKGLQKIITQLDINNDYKQNYITIINNFISLLVKEKTNGKKIYKDKDISQLVVNLTS